MCPRTNQTFEAREDNRGVLDQLINYKKKSLSFCLTSQPLMYIPVVALLPLHNYSVFGPSV